MKKRALRGISLCLVLCLLVGSMMLPAQAVNDAAQVQPQQVELEVLPPETTESVPEETLPAETAEPIPEETLPAETTEPIPEETLPAETTEPTPEETLPAETTEPVPEETTEPVPGETPGYFTEDGHYIAQPEKLSQFTFPEDWSKAALEFCVGNGILQGRDTGLAEGAYTTRAETAAILVRLLGAEDCGTSLAEFTDVSSDAWYYEELSAAVSIGLLRGTSDTTLDPDRSITREQVCTMLSRAFGVYTEDVAAYQEFKDADSISAYARGGISGLKDRGFLSGYLDGTVRPQNYITRAELAKLLFELTTQLCDTVEELPEAGRVIYRGGEEIPEGYCLEGDLIIGCGYTGAPAVAGVTVSGTLTIQGTPGAQVTIRDCKAARLCIAGAISAASAAEMNALYVSGSGCTVDISVDRAYIHGAATLNGSCRELHLFADCTAAAPFERAYIYSASTLNGSGEEVLAYAGGTLNGTYSTLRCEGDDICVRVNGTALTCNVSGDRVDLAGSGSAGTVDIYGADCEVTLRADAITDHAYLADYNSALNTVKTVENWYQFSLDDVYSQGTLEGFVDQMSYSSSTEYLIWVSTKTLTVNIFQGAQGNWELIRTSPCALGKPSTPTVKGVFAIYAKVPVWYYPTYRCRYVSKFYGGYAMHSRIWSWDYSYLKDDSISELVSLGCVRMLDEDCKYIYDHMPIGTTVVVY